MAFAEFEEKQFECAFNVELGAAGPVFSSGQVLENLTGYDAVADPGGNHILWRILAAPRPSGVSLVPEHWSPAARLGRPPAVKLPSHPVSLIIQFKRPEYLQGTSAAQYRFWKQPYFRFTRTAQQHSQLRRLEVNLNGVARVVYASPAFHRRAELENAQLRGEVVDSTGFVSPERLGRHKVWTYISPGTVGRGNPDGEEIEFALFETLFRPLRRDSHAELANRGDLLEHLAALAGVSRAVAPGRARLVDAWLADVGQVADISDEMRIAIRDYATVQSHVAWIGAAWWLLDGDIFSPLGL